MIPIRDHNPSSTTPFLTYLLIVANILVFVFMLTLPEPGIESFINTYALIPAEIVRGQDLFTLVTSMFLHGGIGHIFGNMIFFNIFGDNLEDRLGHIKYLFFYLLCGLGGSIAQILINPGSTIPNLGASGAIAGLMGGYLVLFPRHRVDVIVPLGFSLNRATVPASAMLLYWIAAQFLQGAGTLGIEGGGVAFFAHIGGFLVGAVIVTLFKPFLRKSLFEGTEI